MARGTISSWSIMLWLSEIAQASESILVFCYSGMQSRGTTGLVIKSACHACQSSWGMGSTAALGPSFRLLKQRFETCAGAEMLSFLTMLWMGLPPPYILLKMVESNLCLSQEGPQLDPTFQMPPPWFEQWLDFWQSSPTFLLPYHHIFVGTANLFCFL